MIRKYNKIQAFKNVCKLAHKEGITEVIEYEGTVKLHGTNAAIVYDHEGNLVECQSRNNTITPENDNAGFARFVSENRMLTSGWLQGPYEDSYTVVYGEWCGKGIQKGTAIAELDKMFVIFDAVRKYKDDRPSENLFYADNFYIDDPVLLDHLNGNQVYLITQFTTWTTAIDFRSESSKQAFAIFASEVTEEVGNRCPVASQLGVEGLGEGIVWKPKSVDNAYLYIKTKDQRHSVTKVKTIVPLTEEQLNERTKLEEFVSLTVTDNRIDQAITECGEDIKNMGSILRWIYNDVITEDADLINENSIEVKLLGKVIAAAAKPKLLNILL